MSEGACPNPRNNYVYVAHAFADDPVANRTDILRICRGIIICDHLAPIAPAIYLPQFLDDKDPEEREIALVMCLQMIDLCGQVWYYGPTKNSFAFCERVYALSKGIYVRDDPPDYANVRVL